MSGHIYAQIPKDLWVELRDLKVDFGLTWDKTINYMCDIISRPKPMDNYNPYYPNGKKVNINLEIDIKTEKKLKKFSHAFRGYWHALDYLVEMTKQKRTTFI